MSSDRAETAEGLDRGEASFIISDHGGAQEHLEPD